MADPFRREVQVSCVIVTYNRPDVLGAAIESALAQIGPDLEVIVVDDASPVAIEPVVAPFGARVRYIRQHENGGANRARNAGVAAARGAFVAFLDDDDSWASDKTSRQLEALTSIGADAVLCGYRTSDNRATRVHPIRAVTEDHLRQGNMICGMSGLLARRDVLLREPFDENLAKAQDWDLFVRLAQRGPLAYVPAPLFTKGVDGGPTITSASRGATINELNRRAAAIEKHREWLGMVHYRRRLAETLLAFIASRKDRVSILSHAINRAGWRATLRYVWRKMRGIDRRLELAPTAPRSAPRPRLWSPR